MSPAGKLAAMTDFGQISFTIPASYHFPFIFKNWPIGNYQFSSCMFSEKDDFFHWG